ncbi:hypothetical protein CEXT_493131 [Caerostris extrusa]|uniref:Uncharacterized protein n=1 Tax=Caerostris extrusa TaxID=172846 RepID=A0AAV4S0T6_CAEEX|nr:hypothetical protein CEXT_493131 [Caerostris extrusa]
MKDKNSIKDPVLEGVAHHGGGPGVRMQSDVPHFLKESHSKTYPICTMYRNGHATPDHVLDCLGLSIKTFYNALACFRLYQN